MTHDTRNVIQRRAAEVARVRLIETESGTWGKGRSTTHAADPESEDRHATLCGLRPRTGMSRGMGDPDRMVTCTNCRRLLGLS